MGGSLLPPFISDLHGIARVLKSRRNIHNCIRILPGKLIVNILQR